MSDGTPFGAYHFTVEVFGENIAYPFRSCSGLKDESTVVLVPEGGRLTPHKLVGDVTFQNLVLKRGLVSAGSELYRLRLQMKDNLPSGKAPAKTWMTPNRISGVITQLGPDGSRVRWRFIQGWIAKWEGPDLDATKNEISIETIEIAHEGLEMLKERAKANGSVR